MTWGIRRQRVAAVTTAVLGLAVVALAGGCTSTSDLEADTGPAASSIVLDPGLSHLHGLHVTAAGTLVAGTHTGVFAIDPTTGATSRIGDSDDDFMGLTGVAGTDTLYASGHPGRSSSAPNPLGLRASVDGGRTWDQKSLLGQVDFHALATDGDILVGFDGTTGLRVSTDGGATWSPGAAIVTQSLAATATGVWAVTAEGLLHSTDGARSFTPVPNAPPLVMIAGAVEALWGIDDTGYAWHSRDGGAWQRSPYVGSADALAAVDETTAYAVTDTTLRRLS